MLLILRNRIKKPNFLNKLGFGKDKYYPIYLVVGGGYEQGELTRYDYHFYRKDSNGFWSHKPGGLAVSNRDGSNSFIKNPAKANHTYKYVQTIKGERREIIVNYNRGGKLLWVRKRF